jgi:hypothetical protein
MAGRTIPWAVAVDLARRGTMRETTKAALVTLLLGTLTFAFAFTAFWE